MNEPLVGELLAALKLARPDLKGWCGVVGRSHGVHSEQYGRAASRYSAVKNAIAKAEAALAQEPTR